jgi:hypothetical protein
MPPDDNLPAAERARLIGWGACAAAAGVGASAAAAGTADAD